MLRTATCSTLDKHPPQRPHLCATPTCRPVQMAQAAMFRPSHGAYTRSGANPTNATQILCIAHTCTTPQFTWEPPRSGLRRRHKQLEPTTIAAAVADGLRALPADAIHATTHTQGMGCCLFHPAPAHKWQTQLVLMAQAPWLLQYHPACTQGTGRSTLVLTAGQCRGHWPQYRALPISGR